MEDIPGRMYISHKIIGRRNNMLFALKYTYLLELEHEVHGMLGEVRLDKKTMTEHEETNI